MTQKCVVYSSRRGRKISFTGWGSAILLFQLGLHISWAPTLRIYVNPIFYLCSETKMPVSPADSVTPSNNEVIFPSGFFPVQQDFDIKYVDPLPLRFVKKLLEYDKQITGLEIDITKGADVERIQLQITTCQTSM